MRPALAVQLQRPVLPPLLRPLSPGLTAHTLGDRLFHVAFDDAAVGTRSGYRRQINAGTARHPPRQRAGKNTSALSAAGLCWCRRRRRHRRCFAGLRALRLIRGRRHWGGFRLETIQACGVFAFFQQQSDWPVHCHSLRAGRNENAAEDALIDSLHLHRRLVGLDFGDGVAGRNGVALSFQPLCQRSLCHCRGKGRHQDFDGHRRVPSLVRRSAATIFSSLVGTASVSASTAQR